MSHLFRRSVAVVASVTLLALSPDRAHAVVVEYGPTPYLQFSDSPFFGLSGIVLEDFEDGLLNAPGVTGSGGSVIGPGGTDSVDGDDGSIDGIATGTRSYFGSGTAGFNFTFDTTVTHAGIVWTDGLTFNLITFQAFDASDTMIAEITLDNHGDGNFSGGTAEDRFFGVSSTDGIKRIFINNVQPSQGGAGGSGIEADHLQFGTPGVVGDDDDDPTTGVPAPAALPAGLVLLGLAVTRRRR